MPVLKPRVRAWHIAQAVRVLRAGAVLAYPTEAVFGLGCDPIDEQAVHRILAMKRRAVGKGLIVIGARLDHVAPFIAPLSPNERAQLLASWPGPVTWLAPAAPSAPYWLTGGQATIAVRVSAHPIAAALCNRFSGAIVSTSANKTGQAPARSALATRLAFGVDVDYVMPGACGGRAMPSEIRELTSGAVIRAGS